MSTNHPTTTNPTDTIPSSSPVYDSCANDTTDPSDVPRGDTLWQEYWAGVGNEDWQAARRLLELSWRVRGFYAAHLAVIPEPASAARCGSSEIPERVDAEAGDHDSPRDN